jgi:hypothetical protein
MVKIHSRRYRLKCAFFSDLSKDRYKYHTIPDKCEYLSSRLKRQDLDMDDLYVAGYYYLCLVALNPQPTIYEQVITSSMKELPDED